MNMEKQARLIAQTADSGDGNKFDEIVQETYGALSQKDFNHVMARAQMLEKKDVSSVPFLSGKGMDIKLTFDNSNNCLSVLRHKGISDVVQTPLNTYNANDNSAVESERLNRINELLLGHTEAKGFFQQLFENGDTRKEEEQADAFAKSHYSKLFGANIDEDGAIDAVVNAYVTGKWLDGSSMTHDERRGLEKVASHFDSLLVNLDSLLPDYHEGQPVTDSLLLYSITSDL